MVDLVISNDTNEFKLSIIMSIEQVSCIIVQRDQQFRYSWQETNITTKVFSYVSKKDDCKGTKHLSSRWKDFTVNLC